MKCTTTYREPINMIGLQPLLTTIDVLKEQKDANGIILRPFYTVETFRWLGLPVLQEPRLFSHPSDKATRANWNSMCSARPDIQIVFQLSSS